MKLRLKNIRLKPVYYVKIKIVTVEYPPQAVLNKAKKSCRGQQEQWT